MNAPDTDIPTRFRHGCFSVGANYCDVLCHVMLPVKPNAMTCTGPLTLLRSEVTCLKCLTLLDLIEEQGFKVKTFRAWVVVKRGGKVRWLYKRSPTAHERKNATVTPIKRFVTKSLRFYLDDFKTQFTLNHGVLP